MRAWALLLVLAASCAEESPLPPELGDTSLPSPPPRPLSPQNPSTPEGTRVDLATVMRLAGARSLDLALVREKVDEAYAAVQRADEKLWPTLMPLVQYHRHDGLMQSTRGDFFETSNQSLFLGPRVQVSWTVGETLYERLAASQHWEAAHREAEASERAAVLEAALLYYDLLRETQRALVALQVRKVSEKLKSQVEASFELGRAFRGDMLRARVQAAGHDLEVTRSQEAASLVSIRLASLLRLPRHTVLVPVEDAPVAVDFVPRDLQEEGALQNALSSRPEIKAALLEVTGAETARTGVTWGPIVPEVHAWMDVGVLGPDLHRNLKNFDETRDATVTVGWRIGPGGLFDPARARLATAEVRRAKVLLEMAREKVIQEVRGAWAGLVSARKQTATAEGAMKDAQEALELNLGRFEAGAVSLTEVILTEEALLRARQDWIGTIVAHNQAALRLLVAQGGAWGAR